MVRRRRDGDELSLRARHEHVLLAVAAALAVAPPALLAACRGRESAPAARDASAAVARDALAGAPSAEASPPRGKVVSLVYTSNVGGEYARCGCAVEPLGGLARRSAEVARIRAQGDGIVQVDAGDLFAPARERSTRERPAAPSELERRARLLANAYARLGVTAFSPGERDLALGVPLLQRVLAEAKVPAVSANLVDERGELIFPADRLVEAAGVELGIFGVTWAPRAERERWRRAGTVARDPVAAARDEVDSLRARGARVVVALVHVGDVAENERLLAQVWGVDWAVLGHSGRNFDVPELVPAAGGGGARALEAMSLGRNLGCLDLHVVAGGGEGPYADAAERARLLEILADHERQIENLTPVLPLIDTFPGTAERVAKATARGARIVSLRAAVDREKRALAGLPARITGNWFENRIIPLDASLPDDPAMLSLVADYDRETARLTDKRAHPR